MDIENMKAAVVGAGIIGSWSALHLAEAGVATTLIEQFPLPHDRGSSHGASRAFRFLGDEPLDRLDYSLERWQALERDSGTSLFLKTGLLNFGPPGDAYLEKFMAVVRQGGHRVEWLDHATIAARFPQTRYPAAWGAAFDPDGGILFADRCVAAVQNRFVALGGRILTARVESVEAGGTGIDARLTVDGTRITRTFDSLTACAGPWTARLLPRLENCLDTLLIPVTYWRDPSGAYRADDGFPILFNARLTGVYGLPACEDHGHVKILYHGGPAAAPGQRDLAGLAEYIDQVSGYVRKYLPHLDCREPAILETCRYSMTPDHEPFIDRLDEGLVVGCGFSGSGFKHAPATGRMLAALALHDEAELPEGFVLDRYRLARLSRPGD